MREGSNEGERRERGAKVVRRCEKHPVLLSFATEDDSNLGRALEHSKNFFTPIIKFQSREEL